MRVLTVLTLLVLHLPSLAAQQRDPRLAAIDAYAAKARAEWNAPALALAIVKNDSVIFAKGYGTLQAGGTRAADQHTLFAIGSSTTSPDGP